MATEQRRRDANVGCCPNSSQFVPIRLGTPKIRAIAIWVVVPSRPNSSQLVRDKGCSSRPTRAVGLVVATEQRRLDANVCRLYTSDAADEEDSVDPGGRPIVIWNVVPLRQNSSQSVRSTDCPSRPTRTVARVLATPQHHPPPTLRLSHT